MTVKLPKIELHDSLLKKEQQYLTHLQVQTATTSKCEVLKYLFWLKGSYKLMGSISNARYNRAQITLYVMQII